MFEDIGRSSYGCDVVDDELAISGQEVASLVQLLDPSLVLTICIDDDIISYTPLSIT